MKGLIIAVQFLTCLPTPRLTVSDAQFAASMRWFPAVGLIIGAVVAACGLLGSRVDPSIGALAALAAWVAVTGALHLDGLGDIADASGAAHQDRGRLLAVLADPRVGSFAVVTITLQLIAKFILLQALLAAEAYFALALVPFAARTGPLLWSRWLPDLHAGVGFRFRGAVRPVDFGVWTAVLISAAFVSPSLIGVPVALTAWGWWLRARIGGISGDGHGAGIEVTETLLLLAALVWLHVA